MPTSTHLRLMYLVIAPCFLFAAGCWAEPPAVDIFGEDWPEGKNASIVVNMAKPIGPVNPLLLGSNLEAADSKGVFSEEKNLVTPMSGDGVWDPVKREPAKAAMDLAREMGVTSLRYPGGCLTHNFEWKEAVGPIQERPQHAFGVMEYLIVCDALKAEPVITISAFRSNPEDAADYVSFLNAPAGGAYPWADKRAAWGRPEPYKVRYFEIGNEVDHGTGYDTHPGLPKRRFTPEEYGAFATACANAMRAVDPDVKIGIVMRCTTPDNPWNRGVLATAGKIADYLIVHSYAVGVWGEHMIASGDTSRAMRSCMAAGEQLEADLAGYRLLALEITGRDIPLAITEYNAAFVQDKPQPFRYSLGAAMFSADFIRILQEQGTGIVCANYWQFINGYWGLVRGPQLPGEKTPWTRMPAFYLYRLWGQHFGKTLLASATESPVLEFEGFASVRPASHLAAAPKNITFTLRDGQEKGLAWTKGDGGSLTLNANEFTGQAYPSMTIIPVRGGKCYRLSFEARSSGLPQNTGVLGVGLADARGWDATHSGCGADGVEQAAVWTPFETEMTTLPEAKELLLVWRLFDWTSPATGKVEVRNLVIMERPEAAPYKALTVSASLSEDAKTLYVIVFNKHHQRRLPADIRVDGGKITGAKVWCVAGRGLADDNLAKEEVTEIISGATLPGVAPGGFEYTFPPASMTAFECEVGEG